MSYRVQTVRCMATHGRVMAISRVRKLATTYLSFVRVKGNDSLVGKLVAGDEISDGKPLRESRKEKR